MTGVLKRYWKVILFLFIVAASFKAGTVWSDRDWEKRWADRDSTDSHQIANSQLAARMIEQGRTIEREKAVEYAKEEAKKFAVTNADLAVTVDRLRREASKLAIRLDAEKHTANLASSVRSKTADTEAVLLSNMLGDIAERAREYAAIADERYTAGMTCERIYTSVMQSNNSAPN